MRGPVLGLASAMARDGLPMQSVPNSWLVLPGGDVGSAEKSNLRSDGSIAGPIARTVPLLEFPENRHFTPSLRSDLQSQCTYLNFLVVSRDTYLM